MRTLLVFIAALFVLGCSKSNPATGANSKAAANAPASPAPPPAPATNTEGPFGIGMGADPRVLGGEPAGKPTFYKIVSPPRPHPDFEYVVVQAAENVGVCWVKGAGRNFNSDDFGVQARSHVDEIEQAMETKYGKPKKNDFLMSGSLWTDGRYWMMGLAKGDRVYSYEWDKAQLGSGASKNMDSIYVGAVALSSDTVYVAVEYAFKNKPQCENAAKRAAADAL